MQSVVLNLIGLVVSFPSIAITVQGRESFVREILFWFAKVESRKFLDDPESMRVFTGSMIPSIVVYQMGALFDIF